MAQIVTGEGDNKKIQLSSSEATCEIYLYGAHVTSWAVKDQELLFLSQKAIFKAPKAIRGGIPICWPQFSDFGPLASHGFARNSFFELESSTTDCVALVLRSGKETPQAFPHDFELHVKVQLEAKSLKQTLTVVNKGSDTLSFTTALHSYFRVADVTKAVVEGLGDGHQQYLDNLDSREKKQQPAGNISFDQEVDRIYVEAPADVKVCDRASGHTVTVSREGFPDAVVWNPWIDKAKATADFGDEEYQEMVCVEAAVAPSGPIEVQPESQWSASQTLIYCAKL